jgi:magnesium-transporting ATPase (P-type)
VQDVRPLTASPPQSLGLSVDEAERRLLARGDLPPPPTSRSYASIVRANVFTIFNLILAVLGGLTLAFGDWRDALFLGILVSNSAIGIVQEVRAKRALDSLAALVAPTTTVIRDGQPRRWASQTSSTAISYGSSPGISSWRTASSSRRPVCGSTSRADR